MHGTCVHQCLMAERQPNAAEYAMNFCLAILLASEASFTGGMHLNLVQDITMQGTFVTSNTLEVDGVGPISHGRRAS